MNRGHWLVAALAPHGADRPQPVLVVHPHLTATPPLTGLVLAIAYDGQEGSRGVERGFERGEALLLLTALTKKPPPADDR